MIAKEEMVNFIVKHNPKRKRAELMKLSLPALVIIKVQLEIEIQQNRKQWDLNYIIDNCSTNDLVIDLGQVNLLGEVYFICIFTKNEN